MLRKVFYLVDVLAKRVKELTEMRKDLSVVPPRSQKVITPGYDRMTPRGVESEAGRERVVCPDCLSENFVLPGVKSYTCTICEKEQIVTD